MVIALIKRKHRRGALSKSFPEQLAESRLRKFIEFLEAKKVKDPDRENFGNNPKESPRTAGSSENPSGPSASPNLTPGGETNSTYTSGSSAPQGSSTYPTGSPGSQSVSATGTAAAKSLYEQAKDTAGHAYDAAAEKASSTFYGKKSDISGGLAKVADTVRAASRNLKSSDAQNAITTTTAKYTDTVASKLNDVANYFETHDLRQMMHDAEEFARRNPAVFIGGAAVLGLLAARFLKSSKPKHLTAAAGEPWSAPPPQNLSPGASGSKIPKEGPRPNRF